MSHHWMSFDQITSIFNDSSFQNEHNPGTVENLD
jgi:hypothetical protein